MLQIKNLNFDYEGKPLLKQLSLEVAPGEIACILGPSGIGKSTLLQIIVGVLPAKSGTIELSDVDVSNLPPEARRMSWMTQEPILFPHLNSWQNVAFPLRFQKVTKVDRQKLALEAMNSVGLIDLGGRKISELSGGQRQRLCLARAILRRPELILLDEPLASLDSQLRAQLQAQIRDHVKVSKVAAIWVTHDESEARAIGDAIYLLEEGALRKTGPTKTDAS